MSGATGSWKPSRRLVIGGGLAGLAGWGGVSAEKLARAPEDAKSLGRIGDIDGVSLPVTAPAALPPHDPALPWLVKGGEMNDASALSRTPVYGVVGVTEEAHVSAALAFARANGLKVSISAVRHSMGGHAFDDHALVLDMLGFNAIEVDEAAMTVNVQPGATWHDIQNRLHPKFAVKAMQSSDIFSVGGSISVNAHGMDHQAGSVAGSIRSMRVMLADGSILSCSRDENTDLFSHVVGGYGLFGVVLSAVLDVVPNAVYRTSRDRIPADDFMTYFGERIEPDPKLGLFYGHLSTAPGSFLTEMIVYRYDVQDGIEPPADLKLGEPGAVAIKRLMMNLSKRGGIFARLKWWMETDLEPKVEACTVPRTAAMGEGEACLVTRNEPMHDSVPYLFNDLKDETDILHEYFVPRGRFMAFLGKARGILQEGGLPVLNASVRVVHKEDTKLNYAPEPAFSLVLYINQKTGAAGDAKMRALTRALIDACLSEGGRFFLPYQLHYTGKQLLAAYPELPAFVAAKRAYDPGGLLTSTWYRAVSAFAGLA